MIARRWSGDFGEAVAERTADIANSAVVHAVADSHAIKHTRVRGEPG